MTSEQEIRLATLEKIMIKRRLTEKEGSEWERLQLLAEDE